MLQVQGLTKRFGGFVAVNGVSFSLEQGEILGLIGPNGSGKSTTFNMIAGLLKPTEGSINFEGRDIGGLAPIEICHGGIGRTFQIPRPFRQLTILDNVVTAAFFGQGGRVGRAKALDQAEEALTLVGLPIDPQAEVASLGAAGLKKLELARAIATQ
ncbi:MAG: ABC transporter ATP-binding protein, partial [Alphaproteobacteria bacterium]